MAKETKQNIQLGMFVLTALALFIVGVYYIGNKQNMFGATFRVSSVFNNVNGLQKGNNVRYAGINVGSVEKIVILNDSILRVDMILEEKVQPFIKKDAIANIGSDGLVGNMIVNISPGKGKMPPVEDNEIIESYTRIEAKDMLNTLGNTSENVALLSLNLLEIAENINRGKGTVATLLNDSLLALNLQGSMRNLRHSTQNINSMSRQLEETVAEVKEGEGMLGYLLKDTSFMSQLENFSSRLDTLLIGQTEPIIKDLQQSGEDIAVTSAALKTLVEEINLNEGLVGTLLKDTTLSNDLKQSMQNLNQGTERFNENMEALKHNFLFRKYFKKQEKKKKKDQETALAKGHD